VTAESSEPLAKVVGWNCKRIRTEIVGMTQDELAGYARNIGLHWTASSVGDFEAGRSAPTFATVLAVALALELALRDAADRRGETLDRGVTLADLVSHEGRVELTDTVNLGAVLVAAVCRGQFFTLDAAGDRAAHDLLTGTGQVLQQTGTVVAEVQDILSRMGAGSSGGGVVKVLAHSGLTEHRLAQRLGIDRILLAGASFQLWQSTFSEERDRRAGPDANQQKRGRVSRELRAELEKALADGND
jgi:hypothetical protein